jgi:DMSO/TMAO reductase YedYZ heme-binding membrane subunit
MNEQIWWYLARSAGMAAAVLMVGALVLGVLAATRALKEIDRPAWLVALHRWFSVLTAIAVVTHLVALVADSYVHFGLAELLVPGTSSWRPLAVSLGVISLYLFVIVHVSSLAMKRLPKVWWRRLHMLSYLSVWTALLHAGSAGTDATNVVYRAAATLLTMAAVMAALLRVILGRYAARAAAARRVSGGETKGGERRSPRPARRVDEVEVVVAGDVDDGDAAGVSPRRQRVGGRHDVVSTATDDRYVDTASDARCGEGVTVRDVSGSATEEIADRTVADAVTLGSGEVGDGTESGSLPCAPGGRRLREASHRARWPPAEWPTTDTASTSRRWSLPIVRSRSTAAATSVSVPGHPPPSCPTRRYSMFHAATPRPTRSAASGSIRSRP